MEYFFSIAAITLDIEASVIWDCIIGLMSGIILYQLNRNASKEDKWRETVNERMRKLELDVVAIKTRMEVQKPDESPN